QQLAVPHVRESEALIVAGEDPVTVGRCDQIQRRAETSVGVLKRTLCDPERKRRTSIVCGFGCRARLFEQSTGLADATSADEVMQEAGDVARAERLRKVWEVQGETARADADLRRDREHPGDAEP